MEKDKKERLILYGSMALVLALGLTSKLVKVKTKEVVIKVDYVKPKKEIECFDNKVRYTFDLPVDYVLSVLENGEVIGYKEEIKEEEVELSLGEYIMRKTKK